MNYQERIVKAGIALNKIRPPAVWLTEVAHDDWCPMYRGKDQCWCTPDITMISGKETMVVNENGEISEIGVTQ